MHCTNLPLAQRLKSEPLQEAALELTGLIRRIYRNIGEIQGKQNVGQLLGLKSLPGGATCRHLHVRLKVVNIGS